MTGLGAVFDDDSARRAARRALADAVPDGAPADCRSLGRGNRKRTALVTLGDETRLVVQTADPAVVATERVVLATLADRTDVPVPAVRGHARAGDAAAFVTEHVPGADLHERFVALDRDAQSALARSFGRSLAEVHDAFDFDGYGRLSPGDRDEVALAPTADDWPSWFADYARTGLDRLPPAFDDLRPRLDALFADPPVRSAPPSRLFPWDFRPGNALVRDGEVTAVLDWEAPLAAPPALSVAKAAYLVADWYVPDSDPLRAAFLEGYESVRASPTVRPVHRAAAVCRTAVDSTGTVTNPRYPELDREASVAVHREHLAAALAAADA